MPQQNPFGAFSVTEISAAINLVPNAYGRVGQLNLMPVKGVTQNIVTIEENNGSLALIKANDELGPGNVGKSGKRKVRTIAIPQLIYDEFVSPSDVSGLRAFGAVTKESLGNLLQDRLETARAKHDITLEHLRMGALKGIILDADGTTLVDLYSEFGVSQITVDFLLGTTTTDVKAKCLQVRRNIEDNLKGEVSTGVRVLVSEEFFDKLTSHANVKAAFENYQSAQERLGGDMRNGFTFGGLTFEEYRGNATGTAGNMRFIAANDGYAHPEGTTNTFKTFVGPADFNETVGKLGQVYYAKTLEAKFGRGWDVHTQSNPLPLCMRPKVLIRCHTSN